MRTLIAAGLLLASAMAFSEGGPGASQTIDLKDGGRVAIMKDGTMVHHDSAGKRVKMRDGRVMEAKDGSKLMMKNNAIWKQITEHGTLKSGH